MNPLSLTLHQHTGFKVGCADREELESEILFFLVVGLLLPHHVTLYKLSKEQ